MQDNLKIATLKTLCYADIFEFPMTEDEIWKFLITSSKFEKENFIKYFRSMLVEQSNSYFFLKDRGKIVKIREERQKISRKKIKKAESVALLLSHIPMVKFIGITGSLAVENAGENDDIDLLIITSKNTLWITRFLVSVILSFNRSKRRRSVKNPKDMICLNMFLSEGDLKIKERNLFTAHEIAQVKPLLNKNETFEKFIFLNKWVLKFLPNSIFPQKVKKKKKSFLSKSFFPLELSFYLIQRFYMMRHITIERISITRAMFHPINRSKHVLKNYEKILILYLNVHQKINLKFPKKTHRQPLN